MNMADFNQPRRSGISFTQHHKPPLASSSGGSSGGGSPTAATLPSIRQETAAVASNAVNRPSTSQVRAPLFGLTTFPQHQSGSDTGREHSLPSPQQQHNNVFPTSSLMPLIGSSAVVSASSMQSAGGGGRSGSNTTPKRLSTAGNIALPVITGSAPSSTASSSSSSSTKRDGSASDEINVSGAAAAVNVAPPPAAGNSAAVAASTSRVSGRQVKRPKFADEVVSNTTSYSRGGTFPGGPADKRANALIQNLEQQHGKQQQHTNKTRKSSGAASSSGGQSKKAGRSAGNSDSRRSSGSLFAQQQLGSTNAVGGDEHVDYAAATVTSPSSPSTSASASSHSSNTGHESGLQAAVHASAAGSFTGSHFAVTLPDDAKNIASGSSRPRMFSTPAPVLLPSITSPGSASKLPVNPAARLPIASALPLSKPFSLQQEHSPRHPLQAGSANRATVSPSPLADDVFGWPPSSSSPPPPPTTATAAKFSASDIPHNLHSSSGQPPIITSGSSSEMHPFVVLKPPDSLLHRPNHPPDAVFPAARQPANRSFEGGGLPVTTPAAIGSNFGAVGYEFSPPIQANMLLPPPPVYDAGDSADATKHKRKYVRKIRKPELELDQALASSFADDDGDLPPDLSNSMNLSMDVDAATEASGSIMTGTNAGGSNHAAGGGGGGGKKRVRNQSKSGAGRKDAAKKSSSSSSKIVKKSGPVAAVAGASGVHRSRKITNRIANTGDMKELILLKQQRDELLKIIEHSKDDLRPTTLKKIQKLISKIGELAGDTIGAWKPIDDLRLIHGVEQLNSLALVERLVKFTCHFSLRDIEERWNALLHDESVAKLSFQAIQELPVTQMLIVQREKYMTAVELQMLRRVMPASDGKPYTVEFFDRLLAENRAIFQACRTGQDLMREWQTMQKLGGGQLLASPDDVVAHIPTPNTVPVYRLERQAMDEALVELAGGGEKNSNFDSTSVAEPTSGGGATVPAASSQHQPLFLQNKGAVHDMMERATMRMKHRIRTLEFELPRLKMLLEYLTGLQTSTFEPEFPDMCLAVLRGKMARFLILKPEVNYGRSCPGFEPDINLSYEGPASKVSRQHGRIVLDISGRFAITNDGHRPLLVDDLAVLRGEYCFLNDYSVIELCGLTLVFYVNKVEVAKHLKKRTRKDHDELMSTMLATTAHANIMPAVTVSSTQKNEQNFNALLRAARAGSVGKDITDGIGGGGSMQENMVIKDEMSTGDSLSPPMLFAEQPQAGSAVQRSEHERTNFDSNETPPYGTI